MRVLDFFNCVFLNVAFVTALYIDPSVADERNVQMSFYTIAGVTKTFPLILKEEKVDFYQFIQSIKESSNSDYDVFSVLEIVKPEIMEDVKHLCSKTVDSQDCQQNAEKEFIEAINQVGVEQSEKILFPVTYSPMGDNGAIYKKNAQSWLDSDCKTCSQSDKNVHLMAEAIKYVSPEEYSELYDNLKIKNKQCQKQILDELVKAMNSEQLPEACLQEDNKDHNVCKTMLKNMDIVKDRVLDLSSLVYGSEALKNTEAQSICFTCAVSEKGTEDLKDLLNTLDNRTQCSELNNGEEKIIHSGTAIDDSYKLKRESDGSYSIPLTMEFSVDEDYNGNIPESEVANHYMNRVQKCMEQASQKMLGPNGEQVQIVINKPKKIKEACNNSNVKKIKIGSSAYRSHSKKYEADIDCPTITHEVLHLLGLCDEYE